MDERQLGFPADLPPEGPELPNGYAGEGQQWPGAQRRSRRRWLVIGGVVAAALVALGVGVGASALTAHAGGLPTIQTTLAALNTRNSANTSPNGAPNGGPGFGPGQGPGRGPGLTVSGVSGQTITAKRPDGTSVTITVTSSTTYTRAGKAASLSDVTSGETINVMGTRTSDGSISATRVDIVPPHAGGQVTAISGSTITVKNPQGSATIHTSASTTVQRAGQSASLNDIAVGAQISAEGTKNSDGSLNAASIQIVLPRAGGQIKSVSGSTITVGDPRGATTTTTKIVVTASTKYVTVTPGSNGPTQSASSFSALKTGVFISAEGTKNSDGSLTAIVVTIMPNPPAGAPTHGGPMDGPGDHNGPPAGTPPSSPPSSATTSN